MESEKKNRDWRTNPCFENLLYRIGVAFTKSFPVNFCNRISVANHADLLRRIVLGKEIQNSSQSDCCGLAQRVAIDTGRNGGEINRVQMMLCCKLQAGTIAGGEQLGFSEMTAHPYGTGRVDYMASWKRIALRQFCLARFASAQCPAFRKQFGPGGAMNGSVHAAAAQ